MKTSNILVKLIFYIILLITGLNSYSQWYLPVPNSGNIFDTKKDANNRIWIATDHGILLHDGSNFIDIDPAQKKYKGQGVKSIVPYKNFIYTVLKNGGVLRYDISDFSSLKISKDKVASLVQFDDVTLYLLLEDGTVQLYKNGKVEVLNKFDVVSDTRPLMFEGPEHSLLVSIPFKGLFKISSQNGKIKKDYNMKPTGYNNSFSRFNNRFFFINKQVVYEINLSGNIEITNIIKPIENKNVTFFSPISENKILVVKSEKNIYFFNNGEKIQFKLDRLKNYVVNNLLFYNDNNFFIGTNQGLRKVINIETRLSTLYDTPTQSVDYIRVRRKILPYQKNKFILIGSPNSYIYNPENNSYSKISKTDATLYDAVLIDNFIFAGSEGGGVNKINLNTKVLTKVLTKDIDSTKLYMTLLDAGLIADHTLLIGKRAAVVIYNYKTNKSETISLVASKGRVRSLLLDTAYKTIYVATDSGVYLIDYLTKKVLNTVILKGVQILDLKQSRYLNKRILWAGSDIGLSGFDMATKKRIVHLPITKFNNTSIAAILVDSLQNIWVSTFNGIFAFNPVKNKLLKLVNERQLVNLESNYKSAAVLQDGKLIFGGLNGYDIIDPSHFNFERSPNKGKISLYTFFSNDKNTIRTYKSERIIYNDVYNNLKIHFTITDIEYLSYCNFEYQIDNSNWINLKNETSFILYRLTDGLHKINIRGYDELGRYINFDSVIIDYQTPFYKKKIFLISTFVFILFLLSMIGWTFYRKVRDERKLIDQIAMDLHDEVGTLLTKAIYILKADGGKKGNNQLLSYISEGLFNLRTYIDTFKIKNIRSDEFLDEIKEFKKKFLLNTNIESIFNVKYDKIYLISDSQYRNLKLISYEIHNNIVKHSKATKMKTSMNASDGILYIETEDNGIFNDMSVLNKSGNGIANLKKRVLQLGGQITFSIAASGSGLNIKIIIKL